ncbi:MAG: glycosyltransferase family 39 protein, partial [Verrucomicrobiota bacterium]
AYATGKRDLKWVVWAATALIMAVGIYLRVLPSAGFKGVGFDEALYREYVIKLDTVGLENYPAICERYIEDQRKPGMITKLPPTRFLYVVCGWLWKRMEFGDQAPANSKAPGLAQNDPALLSLTHISSLFAILLLGLTGVAARRMFGTGAGLGILALMSVAPTQIHMAQHALIDGFFAFFATLCLWTLWETLQSPGHTGWLIAFGCSLALMVLVKENAFFVFVALCALVGTNRWTKFGTVTPRLLLVLIIGPLAGLTLLMTLAGGVDQFIEIYRLLVSKAQQLEYAVMTGDGPWYRYLVDLLLVSPIVLCLAIGALFTSAKESRPLLYLTLFMAFSYLIMCNVRFGMNLRYATIWDLPLRALAIAQIAILARPHGRQTVLVTTVLVACLCAYEFRQFGIFFQDFGLYELASEGLLRAIKIIKSP